MTDRAPLADRLRPRSLDEVVGHERWVGPTGTLRRAAADGRLHSMVLWGPPGCGKTSIARALAGETDLVFLQISAVLDGVKALRGVLDRAKVARDMERRGTLLFIDEIHRWNKAQQDALLPNVESGELVLVGATTENPSFELTAPLRSRLEIVRLDPVPTEAIRTLLERATTDPRGLGDREVEIAPEALDVLARLAAGDARRALSDLDRCVDALAADEVLTSERLKILLPQANLRHDRAGDDHFDVVSALIKSLRGSDPDAALYWLARMIEAGEDPRFIARRLIIFASEDVGNADPRALGLAVDAAQAIQLIGMPEGRIILGQAVTWLATCPKSNASYKAIDAALADVRSRGALAVPFHLRNAPTQLMKDQGMGAGYRYPHDHPDHIVAQQYLPDELVGRRYYAPVPHGSEKIIAERLAWWRKKLEER